MLTRTASGTAARVWHGRTGPIRYHQTLLLRFHGGSLPFRKVPCSKEVPEEWVKARRALLEVRSEDQRGKTANTLIALIIRASPTGFRKPLTRWGMQCVMNPDVQVVVSDGLSTDAITANYEEILPPLLCRSTGRAERRHAVLCAAACEVKIRLAKFSARRSSSCW